MVTGISKAVKANAGISIFPVFKSDISDLRKGSHEPVVECHIVPVKAELPAINHQMSSGHQLAMVDCTPRDHEGFI